MTSEKLTDRALVYLIALTALTSAIAYFAHAVAGLGVLIIAAAPVALVKVRLVLTEFVHLRGRESPLVPSVVAWAALVLTMACLRLVALAVTGAS
ncbi:cytochrome-c oxidase subunit 4 domain-containing protein (plasmid) [Rhizobium etli 8C-3]|uniref:Cytochrome-c oxidase subunit 4 domain-containing protein n=1 Tax=Rhizobium etli 8C-3 TaxID=538025 RepID=A0A1L5PF32_RHIET|nr:cytochrome C oxidase subunit IV family protein [Rhizobium etli]APO78817.1 cytochrome-c oxidase subunit 4 domain-containing protein [Rhizobium etli 8C-3]